MEMGQRQTPQFHCITRICMAWAWHACTVKRYCRSLSLPCKPFLGFHSLLACSSATSYASSIIALLDSKKFGYKHLVVISHLGQPMAQILVIRLSLLNRGRNVYRLGFTSFFLFPPLPPPPLFFFF